jgi:hypothetical protein
MVIILYRLKVFARPGRSENHFKLQKIGSANNTLLTMVNELPRLSLANKPSMVAPPRLELGTQGSSSLCSTN